MNLGIKFTSVLIICLFITNCTINKAAINDVSKKSENNEDATALMEEIRDADSIRDSIILENIVNPKPGKLKIVNHNQQLLLSQTDSKCGEWGGDTVELTIYKTSYDGIIYADFKKSMIDCGNPYAQITKENIIEIDKLELSDQHLDLVENSINELIDYKLSYSPRFSHAGIENKVISQDSSLMIIDYPSFQWSLFNKLVTSLINRYNLQETK